MSNDYDIVLKAYPEHYKLRKEVAEIIRTHINDNTDTLILEIGCGTGETTKYILTETTKTKIIAVDKEKVMIDVLKTNLSEYIDNERLLQIIEDIFNYIKKIGSLSIDCVTSSWTIHNFTRSQRTLLLHEIYRILKPNGIFVNMDKYVADDKNEEQKSLEKAIENMRKMADKKISDTAIQHEKDDRHPNIIMKEQEALSEMGKIGFKDITSYTRIGREIVVSGIK